MNPTRDTRLARGGGVDSMLAQAPGAVVHQGADQVPGGDGGSGDLGGVQPGEFGGVQGAEQPAGLVWERLPVAGRQRNLWS